MRQQKVTILLFFYIPHTIQGPESV